MPSTTPLSHFACSKLTPSCGELPANRSISNSLPATWQLACNQPFLPFFCTLTELDMQIFRQQENFGSCWFDSASNLNESYDSSDDNSVSNSNPFQRKNCWTFVPEPGEHRGSLRSEGLDLARLCYLLRSVRSASWGAIKRSKVESFLFFFSMCGRLFVVFMFLHTYDEDHQQIESLGTSLSRGLRLNIDWKLINAELELERLSEDSSARSKTSWMIDCDTGRNWAAIDKGCGREDLEWCSRDITQRFGWHHRLGFKGSD